MVKPRKPGETDIEYVRRMSCERAATPADKFTLEISNRDGTVDTIWWDSQHVYSAHPIYVVHRGAMSGFTGNSPLWDRAAHAAATVAGSLRALQGFADDE
jgi:hypothetical protein